MNNTYENLKNSVSDADITKIDEGLSGMQRGKVKDVWDDVTALYAMIKDPSIPFISKITPIAALLYLVLPLDAVPDFIPVAGLTDDVAIILGAVKTIGDSLQQYKKRLVADEVELNKIKEIEIIKHKTNQQVKLVIIFGIILLSAIVLIKVL